MHGVTPTRDYPTEIVSNKMLFESFTKHAHECGIAVLAVVARQLGLKVDAFNSKNISPNCQAATADGRTKSHILRYTSTVTGIPH